MALSDNHPIIRSRSARLLVELVGSASPSTLSSFNSSQSPAVSVLKSLCDPNHFHRLLQHFTTFSEPLEQQSQLAILLQRCIQSATLSDSPQVAPAMVFLLGSKLCDENSSLEAISAYTMRALCEVVSGDISIDSISSIRSFLSLLATACERPMCSLDDDKADSAEFSSSSDTLPQTTALTVASTAKHQCSKILASLCTFVLGHEFTVADSSASPSPRPAQPAVDQLAQFSSLRQQCPIEWRRWTQLRAQSARFLLELCTDRYIVKQFVSLKSSSGQSISSVITSTIADINSFKDPFWSVPELSRFDEDAMMSFSAMTSAVNQLLVLIS